MELRGVAELIDDQSPMVKQASCQRKTFAVRQQATLMCGFIMMFVGVGVGVSLKVLGREGIRPVGEFTPYLSVIALLTALLGMGLMCFPFLPMMFGNSRSRRNPSHPTNRLAPPQLAERLPTVTEQTTEFLERVDAHVSVADTAPHRD
jgi:hypothetical protein